jgi:hypothetical protein
MYLRPSFSSSARIARFDPTLCSGVVTELCVFLGAPDAFRFGCFTYAFCLAS